MISDHDRRGAQIAPEEDVPADQAAAEEGAAWEKCVEEAELLEGMTGDDLDDFFSDLDSDPFALQLVGEDRQDVLHFAERVAQDCVGGGVERGPLRVGDDESSARPDRYLGQQRDGVDAEAGAGGDIGVEVDQPTDDPDGETITEVAGVLEFSAVLSSRHRRQRRKKH